jgi:putative ABC transport system ATP-binding protein
MNEPEIVLADEPTSDLDKSTESEIMKLMERVHTDGPRTLIMVTHNLELVNYADQVRTMSDGALGEPVTKN